MADDQNEKPQVVRFPEPEVETARKAEERRRVAKIAREIEELGRTLEGRDRRARFGNAERAKSLPPQAGQSAGGVGDPSTPESEPLPTVADMSSAPKEISPQVGKFATIPASPQAVEEARLKAEEAALKTTEYKLKSDTKVREQAERAGANLAQERARIQALEQQLAARGDEQKALAQERARNQALEQQLAARQDEQKALAQERARIQALEQQLAARGDAPPDRARIATARPPDRPALMPPAPAPDKPVTALLPASGKPVMPANHKSRTLTARPINVVLAVLLVVGGFLVGRLSAPGNDAIPTRSVDRPAGTTIVAPAPLSSGAPQPDVSAPPPQKSTTGDAPRDAATAPAEMSATAAATPEVSEPKAIEKPNTKAASLSNGELRELQAWLKVLGFDPGPVDGLVGDRTTAAIKRYQSARQLEETGVPDRTLLRQVRKDMGH